MKSIILGLMLIAGFAFASKYTTVPVVVNQSMGASFNSLGVDVNQLNLMSIQAVWTGGSAAGTLKVQVSNDNVPDQSKVVNWTDYTGSSVTIAGAGDELYNMTFAGYRWARIVFTRSGGTGTMNATFSGKGVN